MDEGVFMKLKFWGVRGSIPAPGPETVRYGGNTSCVEVVTSSARIFFDAGTGIREAGLKATVDSLPIHLFITHTHWDHIMGLPFFAPLRQKDRMIRIYALHRADASLNDIFRSATEHPFFPINFNEFESNLQFIPLEEDGGPIYPAENMQLRYTRLNHPWRALGYRLDVDGASMAYITDTAPFKHVLLDKEFVKAPPPLDDPPPEILDILANLENRLVNMLKGVHTVIFDTMFTDEAYKANPHWGHSSPAHALEICHKAGVSRLVLFHYAPEMTDAQTDSFVEDSIKLGKEYGIEVIPSMEGEEIWVN